jgi:DNA-directed RNA polymerase subunit K/omega
MVYMTKYEKVRIIGIRAKQISMGAPPLVDFTDLIDSISIAEKEFEEKKIPLIIKRKHPDGKMEKFRVCDMDYIE